MGVEVDTVDTAPDFPRQEEGGPSRATGNLKNGRVFAKAEGVRPSAVLFRGGPAVLSDVLAKSLFPHAREHIRLEVAVHAVEVNLLAHVTRPCVRCSPRPTDPGSFPFGQW